MYTRPITTPPERIIENGLPVFGDFNFPPARLDIQKLKQPFSLMPLPNFLTKLRIRTNLCFSFVIDEYVGAIEIMDANWFGFAEVNVWDRKENCKLSYRTFIFRRRTIPRTLQHGVCKTHRKNRYIQILWDYKKESFNVLCRLKGDKIRPSVWFSFSGNLSEKCCGNLTSVIPAPTMRRCAAIHHAALSIEGSLSFVSPVLMATPFVSQGLGFFTIRRSFYRLRTYCHSITGQGIVEGKHIQFNLYRSSQDPFDPDLYNENVLFVDGEPTALPSVTITHPNGVSGQWVIQDTESMIDLSFFPATDIGRKKSMLILRTEYHTLHGQCEGNISNKNGNVFALKEFIGVAKKQYLRL